jgi:hypothetical protein
MSSAFWLCSRSADLQAWQHLAFAAGTDAFWRAQPYLVDDAEQLARWAWDDALAHDGWQDDDPRADTYVEDLAAARQVFLAYWQAGYQAASSDWDDQHRRDAA